MSNDIHRLSESTADSQAAWPLDPQVTYLNHGSFGPAPIPVLAAREHWLREHSANPMDFFLRRMPDLLEDSVKSLAHFLKGTPDNLVFVPNATAGMNIIATNISLQPGDEVLLTDHEYGAVIRIWGQVCPPQGARTVIARLPFPVTTQAELIETLFSQVTPWTRVLVVSHVTSPTGMILPIQDICARARSLGILTCVDGPHAPAQIPVDLQSLDCDFYTASCHKWMSAPFGTGFLYVRSRFKQGLKPSLTSWGRSLRGDAPNWKDEFHWPGTFDPTGFLALPTAIQFLKEQGLDRFRSESHALVRSSRRQLIDAVGASPLFPDDATWYGSMSAVELPIPEDSTRPGEMHPLQRFLWEQHRIEVPLVRWRERTLMRVSAHLYNTQEQIDRLVAAVADWMSGRRS